MTPEDSQGADSSRMEKILGCLQNPLDFEIMMYFITYRELTLSKLEELIPHKSRSTVYRHIQNLLEAEIIIEAREEKVRGHILAKIYQLSTNALNVLPRYTPEQIAKMSTKEKNKLYEIIREALYPTISFMENTLNRMFQYLQLLKPLPEKELFETFEQPDFHLNMNFFSEEQLQLFLQEFEKFVKGFIPKMIELEQKNPEAEHPYIYIMAILPMRKMIDRIMQEKSVEV